MYGASIGFECDKCGKRERAQLQCDECGKVGMRNCIACVCVEERDL